MSQVATGGAIDMPLRSPRSGVIIHVPWLISIWLVDSARRMGGPRTPLAANDYCRRGPPPTFSPGVLRWPDRPWRECRALLVGPRVQISLCCIDSRKDRLFLHRRGCTGDEASLYSDRRQSNFAGQARHYGPLVGAHGRGSPEGKRPTVRRAEQVTRSKEARTTFGAKLDGLATRNTAASRT
jgi:hypothetical protein